MVFGDSQFFIAYFNLRDRFHARARRLFEDIQEPLVTTEWVVAEVGNAFSALRHRWLFSQFIDWAYAEESIIVAEADSATFKDATELYLDRQDKEWSLIDCTSMVVMNKHGIAQVLTHDHHFEQAGFTALMQEQ